MEDGSYRESFRIVCDDSPHHDPTDVAPAAPARVLYVSGPMSGLPDCNYPEFNRVAALLEDAGYTAVNPATNNTGASYRAILRGDIEMLLDCEGIALLPGWENSRGAELETHIGRVLQMDIRPYTDWLGEGQPYSREPLPSAARTR